MKKQVTIRIYNDRRRPHVVWIEPWAEDYTMLPNQQLTVTTSGPKKHSGPLFELVETRGNTQVYVDARLIVPEVLIDDVAVKVGHNRQAAIDAGVWPA
jgi:hypothetical protein